MSNSGGIPQRLMIQRQRPWYLRLLLLLGVIAAVGVAGYMVMVLLDQQTGLDHLDHFDQAKSLRAQLSTLTQENSALRGNAARLERGAKIDRQAVEQTRGEMMALMEENRELREALSFYRGIMAPGEEKRGLAVQKFMLMPTANEGVFRYRLILTQLKKNDRRVEGSATFSVAGVKDGATLSLALNELTLNEQALAFGFRYFQKFEGELLLPDGFSPHAIDLQVKPDKGNAITESYDWLGLLAERTAVNSNGVAAEP